MYKQEKEFSSGANIFSKVVAYYPNGASLLSTDYADGKAPAGGWVGKDASGYMRYVGTATITANAASTATAVKVGNPKAFKVGDKLAVDGTALGTISAIGTDQVTLSAAIGTAVTAGQVVYSAAASGGAPIYQPIGVIADDVDLTEGDKEINVVIQGVGYADKVAPKSGEFTYVGGITLI